MSYDNRFTGAITITPPFTWAEICEATGRAAAITDVRLRIVQNVVDTDTGQVVTKSADGILPLAEPYSGHHVEDDIQAIVDHYGPRGHAFAGHIQVQWDPGFGDPIPQRYVVVDGRVQTVTPRLVWPGDPDALLVDARAVAGLCSDVLGELAADISELFGQTWGQLPDWFTGEDYGRDMWQADDEEDEES